MTSATMPQTSDGFAAQTMQHVLDDLSHTARPDTVFGQPIERGEVTIIPCAEIFLGMGMGSGSGQNAPTEKTQAATGQPSIGQGAGGGGGVRGRPVATIVISRGKVTVQPVVDATRVALAALTTGAFMALWFTRLAAATSRAPRRRGAALPPLTRLPAITRMSTLRQLTRAAGR